MTSIVQVSGASVPTVGTIRGRATGETDDTAALARAIAALPNGGVVLFPPGTYIVNNQPVTSNYVFRGSGIGSTYIKRNADNPIFYANGTPYPSLGGGLPSIMDVAFEHMQLGSVGNFNSPLVSLQGCSNVTFFKVKTNAFQCTHLYWNQVFDSRLLSTVHWEGGRSDGTPVISLTGGLDGYKQTTECMLNNVWFEGYVGPCIATPRDPATPQFKTTSIHLADVKMESNNCSGKHLDLEVSNLLLDRVYVSTAFTTGTVVDLRNCRHVDGSLRFQYTGSGGGATWPAEMVNIDANCYNMRLHVLVSEPQSTGQNVVTMANPTSTPTIDLAVSAPFPLINGNNTLLRTVRASAIRQVVDANTSVAQQSIAKSGRPEWSWGNVANPSGTNEDFYFRANTQNFITLRSRGADPTAAYREIITSAHLQAGSAYNATNLVKLGTYVLWTDSAGRLRIKNGDPSSDTDGSIVGAWLPAPIAGQYAFATSPAITTTAQTTTNTLRLSPLVLHRPMTIDRLGGEVATVGDAGSKVRLGIYADDGNGRPGSLILDAGQIAGDSATVQELTISQALPAGIIWFGGVIQTVTTTQPTLRCNSTQWALPVPISTGTSAPAANASALGYAQTGVSGALPSALSSLTSSGTAPARLFYRAA